LLGGWYPDLAEKMYGKGYGAQEDIINEMTRGVALLPEEIATASIQEREQVILNSVNALISQYFPEFVDNSKVIRNGVPGLQIEQAVEEEGQLIEAYLDIETTGLAPSGCDITVIGIHICNNGDSRFTQLVGKDITGQSVLEVLQGVNVLYLALGFLHWREAKSSGVDRKAPLILVPVELERQSARDRFKLTYTEDEIGPNLSLAEKLSSEFEIKLPKLQISDDFAPRRYFANVARKISGELNWRVEKDEICLGFFSFGKFLMFKDLDPILHSQLRLSIVSILMSVDEASFSYIKEETQSTSGNLSIQIKKLQEAGYIKVKKTFRNNYPNTALSITRKGMEAFENYVNNLKNYINPG